MALWARRRRDDYSETPADPGPAPIADREPRPTGRHGGGRWIPPGESVVVGGYVIPGGMVWVGSTLAAATGEVDPCLIDPSLPLDRARPDIAGASVPYRPAFGALHPAARAAYLGWLASGRATGAHIGYVFLFFYGLERRVLLGQPDPDDLHAIAAELRELLAAYHAHETFCRHARALLDHLTAGDDHAAGDVGEPPALVDDRWKTPPALPMALGRLAHRGEPVPAPWALAWAWFDPDFTPRAAARTCPDLVATLFTQRYHQRHSAGLVVPPGTRRLVHRYVPASSGYGGTDLETALPDVTGLAQPRDAVRSLLEQVMTDLDAYSRYLDRNTERTDSLAALATLPADLMRTTASGPLDAVRAWADDALAATDCALAASTELARLWHGRERLGKSDAVAAATLLGRLSVGIEPDPRLGGPVPDGPILLFRLTADVPATASTAYATATLITHLAVAIAGADGTVDAEELAALGRHIDDVLRLTQGERTRLDAHTRWLARAGAPLDGLRARVATLSDQQKDGLADLLVAVAAADGVVDDQEMAALQKAFRALGLDPVGLRQQVGRVVPPAEPLVADGGSAVPAPVEQTTRRRGRHARPDEDDDETQVRSLGMNISLIEDRVEKTGQVAALLAEIFADDEPSPAPALAVVTTAGPAGLSPAHGALLRTLAAAPSWTRAEFAAAADAVGLLPAGAFDVLNDAALDACDEPVLDGEDVITVDLDIAKEMLP